MQKIFNTLLNRKIPKIGCQYWHWLGFYSKYAPLTLTTFSSRDLNLAQVDLIWSLSNFLKQSLMEAFNSAMVVHAVRLMSLLTAPKGFIEIRQKMKQICKFGCQKVAILRHFDRFQVFGQF